jgi:Domain of unknown function (DUF5753)
VTDLLTGEEFRRLCQTFRHTAFRLETHDRYVDDGKRFHFVITEAVLRYRLCPPEVMLGQLDRLVTLSTMPVAGRGDQRGLGRLRSGGSNRQAGVGGGRTRAVCDESPYRVNAAPHWPSVSPGTTIPVS